MSYDNDGWREESAYDTARETREGYCDYCETTGHTFRSCPARDDL